jgi:hypothetical protein
MSAAERAEIWAWCDVVARPVIDGLAGIGPMLRGLRRG